MIWDVLKKTPMNDNCTAIIVDFGVTETGLFDLELGQCETPEEYNELWNNNRENFYLWTDYINRIIDDKRIKRKDLATYTGIDPKTLRTSLKKIPAKRDTVISICSVLIY
jgi:hypothetical protein